MNDELIPILIVVGQYMVFMHQSELHNVGYPLLVTPDSILVSSDFTNIGSLSYSCIAVDT